MESGCRGSNTATACGKAPMERAISASGSNQRLKAMACTSLQMAINMRENGMPVSEKAMALISLPMVIAMLASITKANLKDSANTSGKMAAVTLDSS